MKEELRCGLYTLSLFAEAVRTYEGDAIWITGKERHGGEPLSIFYYGTLMCYRYLVKSLFASHTVVRMEEDVPVWKGVGLLKKEASSDIVIGDLAWPYFHGFSDPRFLRVPPVIAHKIRLPQAWTAIEEQFRKQKTTRDELRKVEKYGLGYRIAHDRAAAERFYDTMYVPYVSRRHGDATDLDSRSDVVRAIKHGNLIEITQGDRVVAGGVLHRFRQSLRFLWLGILDDLDKELSSAASAALYCYSMQHAIAQGCRELNLMYSPLSLNDGIHRYKRKLGSRVSNDWRLGQLVMRVAALTPAVVNVFAKMPFAVSAHGDAIRGRILLAEEGLSPDDIRKVGAYYACDGVEGLNIFSARPLSEEVLRADYSALDVRLPALQIRDLTKSATPAADFCRP
jgi:hypothetical protein